jgi:two-component system CheB/CheR fusion protein
VENLHPDDIRAYFDNWNGSLATGKPFQVEFRFKDHRHPGEYCWFLAKALAIYDADGSVMKWHGTFTDINDLKLAQLAVQRLVKEKEDFISIASHELKTPVTTLKGSIQLLEQQTAQETFSEDSILLISMAGRQIKKLSRMVGDLLDVAKMDADRLLLIKADFLLKDAIGNSLEQVRYLSRKRSILVEGTTDISIHAHKERIEQVITNFLSNALKYSSEGSDIRVSASVEHNGVKVMVTDDGIGIPASKLPYVFDRFFRVEESSDRFSGLGLGLYISAEIISRHDGQIGVDSEPGKGSTFWFTLPRGG